MDHSARAMQETKRAARSERELSLRAARQRCKATQYEKSEGTHYTLTIRQRCGPAQNREIIPVP
jgi:hypothetical protein